MYSSDGFIKKRICDDDRNIGVTCGLKDPTTDGRNEEYTFEIDFASQLIEEIGDLTLDNLTSMFFFYFRNR